VYDPRQHIIEIAELVYQRFLTDSAGGNLSLRHEGLIYVSPRYMGSLYHYRIRPEQISVLDAEYRVLDGPAELSREIRMHLAAYEHLPEVGSVIHAHPRWLMVFAVAQRAMPPVLEYTTKFGLVECIAETQMHTQVLADRVIEVALRRREQLQRVGLGVLLPAHGVAVLGKNLDNTFDILERLESNARCILLSRLLPPEA
jgi:L-fuculose-phosphate aldolase